MTNKKLSEKKKARMYFKRLKACMNLTREEFAMVKKFYPFVEE